jgi:predicted ATPase
MHPIDNLKLPNLKRISLLRDGVKKWDIYPFNIPAIEHMAELNITRKVCFFVGENGSGKSTLLEAIAEHCGYGKEGGSKNISYETMENDDECNLSDYLRISWSTKILNGYFLRAESFFNIATYLDQLQKDDPRSLEAYGGKSLHRQSHGESFLSLFQNRFSGKGIYILDEPEAALSPQRQLSLLVLMHNLITSGGEAQFIIATHSPIILAYPDAQILSFDNSNITEVDYKDTQPYQIMSSFLANPDSYLKYLFQPKEE